LLTAGPELLIVTDAVFPVKEDIVHPLLITTPEIVTVVVPDVLSVLVINEPVPFIKLTVAVPLELEFGLEKV
jgi:hypothetical protein